MSKNKKNAVAFIKPNEPAFIRRMKEQIGYKEGPTVDTKKEEQGPCDPDNEDDKDDEKPTVVVLSPGDLTAEEAEKLDVEYEGAEDDKIVFKKPVKRAAESKQTSELRTKLEKRESPMEKVKNKNLLSFDDEEDDDT